MYIIDLYLKLWNNYSVNLGGDNLTNTLVITLILILLIYCVVYSISKYRDNTLFNRTKESDLKENIGLYLAVFAIVIIANFIVPINLRMYLYFFAIVVLLITLNILAYLTYKKNHNISVVKNTVYMSIISIILYLIIFFNRKP